MTGFDVFLIVVAICGIPLLGFLLSGGFRRNDPIKRANAYGAALDARWADYLRWRDSRICLGGCGKTAKDCSKEDPWITEECCMECWKAGKHSGRSSDGQAMAERFRSPVNY